MNDRPPASSDLAAMRHDKNLKRRAAFNRAMDFSPNHIMFLDSDDCVSRRLAGFVAEHQTENGWYVRSGYIYAERQQHLHFERLRFHKWCGSAQILRPELLDFVTRGNDAISIRHTQLNRQLKQRNTPIRPLPFPGAVYSVSHGDNFWDYESILWPDNPVLGFTRRILFHRSITPEIQEEFGLYPVS